VTQSSRSTGRVVFDLSSAAQWSGPPVGIIRAQRELARWARANLPNVTFAFFDSRTMVFREISDRHAAAFIAGAASVNAWSLPDPTGGRKRRSDSIPRWLGNLLQLRRTTLRVLERVRLADGPRWRSRLAERLQGPLITPRHRAPMFNADGSRRPFLPLDVALGEPVILSAEDTLVAAGSGWTHTNIEAIAAARAVAGFRFVVVCYDVIPLIRPDFFVPHDVSSAQRYWAGVARHADLVIANAQVVADDFRSVARSAGVVPPPVAVCPLGANPPSVVADATATLPEELRPGGYALFVSTIEPRKGHDLLYRVWLRLLEANVPQAADFKLVFVGRPGWMVDELMRALETDPRIAASLLRLNRVTDAELDVLYRSAAFCLYPSQYEGYGLPVVEAFSRGKAMLVSDGGALSEVAAGLTPPLPARDEDAWFEVLRRWIQDPAARAPFEAAIRERFRHPTWDEAAAGMFRVIAEARDNPAASR
jgi:glycosyltransferase involved in cell wall biosynthesis